MIQPHAYQVPIIRDVAKALKRDGKTLMVMATGTGKTITGALVVQKILRSKERMLFLCHTNDILRQSMLAYGKVFNGSRSMGMFTGEEKVDPKTVQFLFASFQTMNGWKSKFDPKAFDMIVVDESHHAQAETYRPTIEYFRPKFLLGKTATPDREDGKNIRDLFGTPSVTLSLEEAIARKYLSDIDYKLMTVGTASRDAINELKRRVQAGERITLRELNDNIFIERLDSDIADDILSYKAQGIIFCTDIKQAEGMAKLLKKARPYHSKLDRNELDADLEGFRRGRIKYLLTVNMFNEGIDVPDTELVVFLRSTESRTVYLQQLGRGLRKSPGKTKVTVLDFVGNCDRIKMVSDFMGKIDDFGPKGKGPKRGPRINREIDVSSIIFELDEEARDIRDIMSRIDVEFYPTMKEAMEAVRRIRGIDSRPSYNLRYRKDPRLPSNPEKIYKSEWKGWTYFLTGGEGWFYPTMKEAMEAVKRLGIKGQREYYERYREDPRLTSRPHIAYRSEWKSWTYFLTGVAKVEFYPTMKEAMEAVRRIRGIDSPKSYLRLRHKDPRLPSQPERTYKSEWKSWTYFLTGVAKVEFYPTMKEAMEAVKRIKGIDSKESYNRLRHKCSRLPSHPDQFYTSEWKSWPHFLGKVK
ncbi:DEAD/DEAH box helicase family protein [Candidatus Uhrbacteria bacterium]|nr:MAG: DEAD/DEAH box helicase family protein [Candidatus Uhrbacteria bacterium]